MKKRRLKQQKLYWPGIVVALASFSILGARLIAAPTTFIVNSTADSADPTPGDGICGPPAGPCTLRAAIEESNANDGADTITFNIPGAGVKTIAPTSPLPTITDAVIIDGYTQPGSSANTLARGTNAVLRIEISGAALPANNLLIVNGTGSTLRGLVINRGQFNNLELRTGGGHTIEGCFIGTNVAGSAFAGAAAGSNNAISIFSDNNLIGGPSLAARNLLSGISDEAIYVGGAANAIQNNLIGTNASGTAAIANGSGVRLGGFEFNAATTSPSNTRILQNVISGSGRNGIEIFPNAGGVTVTNTAIQGNLIGLNAAGTAAIANGGGIIVDSSDNPFPENTGGPVTGVQIGGTEAGQGNVISGNTNVGISVANPVKVTGVVIQGNTVGLNEAGTAAVGNGNNGIVANATGMVIGGSSPQARNVISGNGFRGIEFGGTANLTIQNNFIGTNRAGTAALGNGSDGIRGGTGNNNAVNITIENNVISGNGFNTTGSGSPDGIHIQDSGRPTAQVTAPFIRLRGNIIGLDASGTTDLGNRGFGLTINRTTNVRLDSTSSSAAERNIISGNDSGGIQVFESSGNQIQGNLIGLAADESTLRGNGGDGITVVGNNSGNTLIGATPGTQAGGNRIAGNAGHGVSTNAPSGIRISGNAIFENGALGINLAGGANESPQGVTPNDADDSDTGPNALQNFPEFTFVNASGGNIRAFGELRSQANTTYRLEFYTSQTPDPTGFGEGQTFLGAEDVTTNEFGAASFEVTFPNTGGPFLTATATDPNGNTSEFSQAFVAATLTPESATSPDGTAHTVTATLLANNLPQANVPVNFLVVFGPNEGSTGTATTDAQGQATFTYTGSGGVGTDNIRASGNFGIIPFAAIADKAWTTAPLTLSINDVTLTEGDNGTSDAVFTITLSRAVNSAVSVSFSTRDNEASAPDDFTAQNRTVTIEAGETTATVTVPIVGDVIAESDELFTVVLTNPQGATLLRAEGNGTIVDNDQDSCSTTVITTADSGAGSLREAINCSNSTPGVDTISFNIPGAGVRTIAPTTPLPIITDAAVIDGYTQPGASANTLPDGNNTVLLIELSGANQTSGNGLVIESGNSTVRGLVVNRFTVPGAGNGIILRGNGGNRIEGNFIGIDPTGSTDLGQENSGVVILNTPNNVIGGTSAGARNVISGNGNAGISVRGVFTPENITPTSALIQGNFIGTNAAGTAALGNSGVGVSLSAASGNTIGGTVPGARNVISANRQGIHLETGAGPNVNNTIQGNFVGTDVAGTVDLGNAQQGVRINDQDNTVGGAIAAARNLISGNGGNGVDINNAFGVTRNVLVQGNFIGTDVTGTTALGNDGGGVTTNAPATIIGGTAPGAGNRIAFNRSHGVLVVSTGAFGTTTGVVINGNEIFRNHTPFSNEGLGINLEVNTQVNLNDAGDADTGANNFQNFPVLTAANNTATGVRVRGTLNSTPNRTFRIELFFNDEIDPSGFGEGQTFLGAQNVTTNAVGNAAFDVTFANASARNRVITGTATGADGTSEFSAGLLANTLLPETDTNPVGTSHVVTSSVILNNQPAQDVTVNFRVLSGPNAGRTGTGTTNAAGQAAFTYTGSGGPGTDIIEASGTVGLAPFAAVANSIWTAVTPTLSINDVTVTEGNNESTLATFTIRLSAASNSTVTVSSTTADSAISNNSATADSDYTATTGTLTFGPGVLTQTFTVPILGDTLDEANERFFVNLSTPTNATIADGQGIGTILDDDATPTLSINDVRVAEGNAGTTNAIFTVTLSALSSQTVSVNAATSNDTAIADTDYTAVSRTLIIPAGTRSVTILVPVIGDTADESNESFFINLSTPVNATVARASGVGTIADDDVPPAPLGPIDVTPQTSIASGNAVPYPYLPDLFRPTQFRQVVTLRNTGGAPITGPVTAILANLSSGVTLTNAIGVTTTVQPLGSPFVYVNLGPDNIWRGDEVLTVTFDFRAPAAEDIHYNLLVFARWMQSPSPVPTPLATLGPQPGSSASSLSGRVATGFGFGLRSLQVHLSGNGRTLLTTTGSNGEYSFNDLPAGTYTITPHFPGLSFSPPSRTLTVGSSYRRVDFFAYTGPALAPPSAPEPIGIVAPAPTVTPAPVAAPVPTAPSAPTATAPPMNAPTPKPVMTTQPTVPAQPNATGQPTSTPATAPTTVPIATQRYRVSGHIATSSGFGLRGITVSLVGASGPTPTIQTDAAGNYQFTDVAPGLYTVEPFYRGLVFIPESRAVNVTDSHESGLSFTAQLP